MKPHITVKTQRAWTHGVSSTQLTMPLPLIVRLTQSHYQLLPLVQPNGATYPSHIVP